VEKTGLQRTRGWLFGSVAAFTRTEWRSLFVALAISLVAHLLVLATKPPLRKGDARLPVLNVTLTGAFVAQREGRPRVVPSAPPRAPMRAQTQAPRTPAPVAMAAPQAPATVGPRTVVVPSPPQPTPPVIEERPQARIAPRSTEDERGYLPADTLDMPPNPLSNPVFGEVTRRVSGRRLQTTVWIDESGIVRKAFVKRNELGEEDAALLEQALATVRFAPGQQAGHAVPSLLEARLCFDMAGVLDFASPECLRPPVVSGAEAGNAAAPPPDRGEVAPPR